ncbi:AAA family ATPase [Echinicola marina]|uniref:AAA family ATPase n=1 Tax=Echinicola marina TaxID=2859768 RepID=UPI001CF61C42|nr:AAA family ATPase [Echinicola marina]
MQSIRKKKTNMRGYPYDIPALSSLKELSFDRPVTFFVGENGSGKSTLLEAIAIGMGLNPEGGSRHFHFATEETHSLLFEDLKMIRGITRPKDSYFLRAESFYNVASEIDRIADDIHLAYGNRSLHTRSHGESFMTLLEKRLLGKGFYLFDEIESGISPSKQMEALVHIHRLVKNNSQFIISTHSPILLSYPHADIYDFSNKGIRKINYEETDTFRVTKDFLNNYQHMQKILFG